MADLVRERVGRDWLVMWGEVAGIVMEGRWNGRWNGVRIEEDSVVSERRDLSRSESRRERRNASLQILQDGW